MTEAVSPGRLPAAAAAPAGSADRGDQVDEAWALSYLDAARALALGRELAASGDAHAAWGWLHVGLGEARMGTTAAAQDANARAGALFRSSGDARGLALADEVQAIVLRRQGDVEGSRHLQHAIDARTGIRYTAHDRFLAHNSRAITHKLLGRTDEALRHFYAASEAAQDTGWPGPRITALCNLGGYHHDLFNLEDARALSEQALREARAAGAMGVAALTAANLIVIHHAAGQLEQARALTCFLLEHAHALPADTAQRHALPLALGHLAAGELTEAQRHLDQAAAGLTADGEAIPFWAWLQARVALDGGDAQRACDVVTKALAPDAPAARSGQPFDLMELHKAGAAAHEALGEHARALSLLRQAHALYERLVGRSARARYAALLATHEVATAQRERDRALDSRRTVEVDHRRLADLNQALQAKMAETELLHAKLKEQAVRDPLTGLHNRRYLFEVAPGLLELSRRQNSSLCVVLLDLDNFKLLNDTYGHTAGDAVLLNFSALLSQMFRRSDVICRHGGEEFVAVMPDIDADGAEAMLHRLLAACQAEEAQVGRRRVPGCSFSAGLAIFPAQGHTLEQLLSRADKALYSAKRGGRARIERAPPTGFNTFI